MKCAKLVLRHGQKTEKTDRSVFDAHAGNKGNHMKNKTWLCALMIGVAAMTAACNESSSSSDIQVEDGVEYFLACQSPVSRVLKLEEGQLGSITMMVSQLDSNYQASFVNGVTVQGLKTGTAFSLMDGTADMASVATDAQGLASFTVTGVSAGTGKIVFSTVDSYSTTPVEVTVEVTAAQVDPVPEKQNVDYNVKLSYAGIQKLNVAQVMVYPGGNCANLIKSGMTVSEIGAIPDGSQKVSEVGDAVLTKDYKFSIEESDVVNYAVVARAMKESGGYVAYGCTDGMNRDNKAVMVALGDGQADEIIDICETNPNDPSCQTPVDCEKDPTNPACDPVEPEIPDVTYAGNYFLMSQFNALSLLPSASQTGETVKFQDMLAGDWIQFVLDFLSNPEETLPNVLTQQLLPLILDATWFRNLIEKIPTLGPVIVGFLDSMSIDDILAQFGVKQIISDYLNQLTSKITWWDSATGGIEIANNIAKNFTLYGNFRIAGNELNEQGQIAGNAHNYSSVLYHNGTFTSCLIGDEYGRDINNKLLCEIPIATLDEDASSVRGTFTAQFGEIVNGSGDVNIASHSLNLAYGKLVYAALIQILPTVINMGNVKVESLSDILAYYVGVGLINLYNDKHPDAPIDSTLSGCDAVGEVLVKLITDAITGDDGKVKDWANLISVFVQPTTLSSLCTTGLSALDTFIDSQLNKLSVSTENVTFSSDQCKVNYNVNSFNNPTRLAYFGQNNYVWGMDSKADTRCTWDVSIKISDDDVKTIKGKFYALGAK